MMMMVARRTAAATPAIMDMARNRTLSALAAPLTHPFTTTSKSSFFESIITKKNYTTSLTLDAAFDDFFEKVGQSATTSTSTSSRTALEQAKSRQQRRRWADLPPNATSSPAAVSMPATQQLFVATTEWSEVLPHHVLPPGLEIKIDLSSDESSSSTVARLLPS